MVQFGQAFAFTAVDIFTLIKPQPRGRRPAAPEATRPGRGSLSEGDDAAPLQRLCADHPDRWRQRVRGRVRLQCSLFLPSASDRPPVQEERAELYSAESFNHTVRRECLGWAKYRVKELPALAQDVEAFLEHYYYHRPRLAFTPMRLPLTRDKP